MTRPKLLAVSAGTVLASLVCAVEAAAYCSELSAPSCANRYGAFDDEWEFDRCNRGRELQR
jgi:hypothetical protein